ncbi:MAG TPA: universal stress protein [Anaerolineae bacterium]|nr:universal stress protein [Anaerolineae bacterium]
MFHHVLVGYDGSAHGKKALEYGIDFAMHAGAELTIVTVFPRVPEYLGSPQREEVAARLKAEAQRMAEMAAEQARACNKDGMAGLLLGGVSDRMVNYARVPVLVVK